MAILRIAGAYLSSPSNTYIHRDMTPFMSSMLLVCLFFFFLFCFGLSPRTYIPNPQILRSASLLFPHVYLVHSFLSVSLPSLYISSPMVPHSRVLNPRTGHTMNISHERTILLQNVDLQVISISVCVPVHHKRGSKDPLRVKVHLFFRMFRHR